MSLVEQPSKLQALSNYSRGTKPKKVIRPKLKLYRPTGHQYQTNDFILRTDQNMDNQNTFIEDSRISNFTFRAFLQIQTCLLILSITSFITQIHFAEHNDQGLQFQANILLMTQSAITLIILILLAIRYKLNLQLRKQQKIESFRTTLFHIDYFPYMILEMIICSVHPTYFSKDTHVILFQPYDQINIQHQMNDLLALGMLCRVYLILRAIIASTMFSGTRAARLCRVYGCEHSITFAIKSIMKQIPLRSLGFLFLLMILIYGQGLRISQHDLIKHFPSGFDLSNYSNCFWAIIITMGTVGYGDYFPRTYPGRAIIFLASISGVIMTSLLIITLSDYLSMNNQQSKSYITHQRLKLRQQLQQAALLTIKQTSLLSSNLQSANPNVKLIYDKIKKQSGSVKVIVRKLQTMMDNDNVSEEMNRLFQILQMSLKQIYQNQLQVKDLLQSLYYQERDELREIKFSFTTEIQQMIKQN